MVVSGHFFLSTSVAGGYSVVVHHLMPPKRERVVSAVDYHIRTRSSTRRAPPETRSPSPPRVVALVPETDSDSEGAGTRRLYFDISPTSPIQTNPVGNQPAAMDPALAQAIADFVNGAANDRVLLRQQHDDLVDMLAVQQQESTALRALVQAQQQQAGARINNAVVDTIPKFEGGAGQMGSDWIRIVNQVGNTEGWTNVQKGQVAIRRLGGVALQWHMQTGNNIPGWANWSQALSTTFANRLSPLEWYRLMDAKVQQSGETGVAYAMEKIRLFDSSPHVLTDAQKVSYLVDGLANWRHIAGMMSNPPVDVEAFLTRLRDLEALPVTSRSMTAPLVPAQATNPFLQHLPDLRTDQPGRTSLAPTVRFAQLTPPYPPPVSAPTQPTVDVGTALLSMSEQISGLVTKLNGLSLADRRRNDVSYPPRQPDLRACHNCGAVGHLRRNCPRLAGNGNPPSAGYGQR